MANHQDQTQSTTTWLVDLDALNGSGVEGTALLLHDLTAQTLTVTIDASGLEADMPHPQHIHGRFADTAEGPGTGRPLDSVTPTLLTDEDDDGFIELLEGLDTYGPVLVPLTSPAGGALEDFPTAPDGTVTFTQTYDLTDSAQFGAGIDAGDLLPLDFREIVLHGMTVEEGVGEGTPGEVNGDGGYLPTLPVAAGDIIKALDTIPAEGLRIEAEDFADLGGFIVEDEAEPDIASGFGLIRLPVPTFGEEPLDEATASTMFNGPSGTYDVRLAYFDEGDGEARFAMAVGDEEVGSFIADREDTAGDAQTHNRFVHTFEDVQLDTGDLVSLMGTVDETEFTRMDYVEFVPASDMMIA